MWVFAILGLVMIVVLGLVLVGRETARLAGSARPAVFELNTAVEVIADELAPEAQARISHDDVRWVLLADADLLEEATADPDERRYPWSRRTLHEGRSIPVRDDHGDVVADAEQGPPDPMGGIVDEDMAVARIITAADDAGRDLADEDVAAILAARLVYLERIGALGGRADPAGGTSADGGH